MMFLAFKEFTKYVKWFVSDKTATAVITFGRMNPPTMGHLLLMNKLRLLAIHNKGRAMVFLSHSQDSKKNPLSYEDKYKFVKMMAPSDVEVVHSPMKTIYQVVESLSELGVKRVIVVVGSDRVAEFSAMKKYTEKYNLESIEIVSAGERNDGDNLDDITNVSASALRKLAVDGEKEEFISHSAFYNKPRVGEDLYNKVRKGLGL